MSKEILLAASQRVLSVASMMGAWIFVYLYIMLIYKDDAFQQICS